MMEGAAPHPTPAMQRDGGQRRFEGEFPAPYVRADPAARVAVLFTGPGAVGVDVVSVMPAANVAARGPLNPWPFRADLLQMLKDLRPR